ncbi:MAG: tetratricopeptide repeat protein [Terriglobales bacterium]|jgi:Tfp pilus assembly protein PilF
MRYAICRLTRLFALAILVAIPATCLAQSSQTTKEKDAEDPKLQHALELFRQGKFVDALPLYEALAVDHPSDPAVLERWAWCTFQSAATVPDQQERRKVRARAHAIAVRAKSADDNSQILQLMIEQPEDGGSEVPFSDRKEVDEAMKAAEADYSRGKLDKAREGYLRVVLIDPNNYEAALFIGDVYFKQHVQGSAGEWFARAIQIDPNRETAYRYWGDSLVAMGKEDEARSKFIDAIVADPYSGRSWTGLQNWLQRNKVLLNNIRLKDRSSVTAKDDKNVNITLDSSLGKNDPDGDAWTAYALGRAGWHTEKNEKEFPNIPRDRHTLQEEAYALNFMVTVLKEEKGYEKKLPKLDPSLRTFIKIQEAGFVEPFVLLNRADQGIAQDYPTYRAANRDKIRRYLDEIVVPKTPSPTPAQAK